MDVRRVIRRDGGLVWQLVGERVEAIGDDRARLSKGRTITRRSLVERIEAETSQ
jgi:hypothetical protein